MILDNGITIEPVLPEHIDQYWPEFEKYLLKVIDYSHGEVNIEGIRERLATGTDEIIIGVFKEGRVVGCCVLGISVFETGKRVLQMPYCGGENMKEWITEGFELVKEIAKSQDCTHIRGCGRAGWDRVLPELVKIRTVYECEVTL